MSVMIRLARYLWPKKRSDLRFRVLLALLFLVASKVVSAYVPLLYKDAIDAMTLKSGDSPLMLVPIGLILAYGGARLLSQLFGEIKDSVFARVSQFAQRSIALETFEHLHCLSLAFHLDRQTGGLTRAIERGTRGLQFVLQFLIFNILPTLIEIFLVTGILYYSFGWKFAAIILSTIVIYISFTLFVSEWRVQFRRSMNEMDSEANTKAVDSLLNFETVKYFGNETHEYDRYDKSLRRYEDAAVKSQTSLSLLNMGQGAIIGVGLIGVMWLAAYGITQGNMTLGDFVLVNTYLMQLYLPLNFLGFVYREMKQGLIDTDKMFELLDVNLDIRDLPGAQELNAENADIVFDDVGFQYNPDRVILKNVSFVVPAGRRVAIVGPSGSGKSTIARLIFRFYDVTSGSIRIGKQDTKSVTQSSLRRSMGVVPQDTVLFNDTIEYNIRYGQPDSTTEQIRKAANMAQIDSFIEKLPQKYLTTVGERGLKLSGGEKQRVAIARTILKGPKILIFDEATSALDTKTEQEILKSLDAVSRNRTTLVIAHRLSTVVDCDEIIVLSQGEIVERGRHADLLNKSGEYASMWRRQQESGNGPS